MAICRAPVGRQLLLDCRQLIPSGFDHKPDIGPVPPATSELGRGLAEPDGAETASADQHHSFAGFHVEVGPRLVPERVAIERDERVADRHADEPGVAVVRKVAAARLEGQRDVRHETAHEPVGEARRGVGLVDDPGHAREPGGEHGRHARVAPHPENDVRPTPPERSERLRGRPNDRYREEGKSPPQVLVEGQHVDGDQLVAGRWDQPALEPPLRTDERDLRIRARRANGISGRETGVDVTAGSAGSDDDGRGCSRSVATSSAPREVMTSSRCFVDDARRGVGNVTVPRCESSADELRRACSPASSWPRSRWRAGSR